jgi:hypothetical protein
MKFPARTLLALGAPLMLAACATIGAPQPPSLELPKPPLDLHAVRKGNRVTLTWTIPNATTDRQTIRGVGATTICRGLAMKLSECGKPVGEVPGSASHAPKAVGSFTDTLPAQLQGDDPAASITYAVEVANGSGRNAGPSNQVHVPLLRAPGAPQNFSAQVTSQGVALTWSSDNTALASHQTRSVYRIYRTAQNEQKRTLAGEVAAENQRKFSFTDSGAEWGKTYDYVADAVTVIDPKSGGSVEGDDTPAIHVVVNDTFPPAVPWGLQAVFSGPGQAAFVDLIWAPVTDVDLDGYNIYRHEEGKSAERINAAVVKSPAYRDTNVASGRHYFYSVSAIDIRGNESARSDEADEQVP